MSVAVFEPAWRPTVWLSVLLMLAAACDVCAQESLESLSENEHYRVQLTPSVLPVPLNQFHRWELRLEGRDGKAFDPTQLAVFGGMPGHLHGLPSAPRVTERLATGHYVVEGLRFNMAGTWELFVGISGPAGSDKARFSLAIGPGSGAVAVEESFPLGFSTAEIERIRDLGLPATTPADESNRLVGNASAIALGKRLFADPRLSAGGDISCATCHVPARAFTDGRRVSVGSLPLKRNAPSLLGVARSDWFYWDGRRDSLWAQALTPIETHGEMDNTRIAVARLVLADSEYRGLYSEAIDGTPPDATGWPDAGGPFGNDAERLEWQRMPPGQQRNVNRVFTDIGKSLAAFVATLEYAPTRFDQFAAALAAGHVDHAAQLMTEDERAGLKLFLDEPKSKCLRCHNGPSLTSFGFHNVGTAADADGVLDFGRAVGIRAAQYDPFNCLGEYSDAERTACKSHRFGDAGHPPVGAFKVPSLRELLRTAPYMHDGRFPTLSAVIAHYRAAAPSPDGSDDLFRLEISDEQAMQLEHFLRSLSQDPSAHHSH